MHLEISPHELRILLSWWETSSQGFYGTLGGVATMRSITLADRLLELRGTDGDSGESATARAVREAEDLAASVVREEAEAVRPEMSRRGYELIYAGVVHALPREDPRYWSVVDLQAERIGAERPTYEFFSDEVPVWREGQPCIGSDGLELRTRLRAILQGWLAGLPEP